MNTDDHFNETQCNRYLQFDLSDYNRGQINAVGSGMGTGKNYQSQKLIVVNKNVLLISSRVTYTISLATKYGLTSYLDAQKNKIPLRFTEEHPKWIIQIDSLHLFENAESADLILLDEIESVLAQMTFCQQSTKVHDSFINLIKIPATTILMDAELQPSTVSLVEKLSGRTAVDPVINSYKSHVGEKILVKDYYPNDNNTKSVIIDVLKLLTQNKRVVCCVSSKKLGFQIREEAKKIISDHSLIKMYHGDQYALNEKGELHKTEKAEDFKDVNTCWKDKQLLIYTGTLSCGVDYTPEDPND